MEGLRSIRDILMAGLFCLVADSAMAGDIEKPKAAAGYDLVAKYNLAVSYEAGEGVGQDLAAAYQLYAEVADKGLPDAQNNLAAMYFHGKGTAQDLEKAYQWFTVAAWFGFPNAARNRDIAAKRLSPEGIANARRLAGETISRIESFPHGIAIYRVPPDYPPRALSKHQTGSVDLEFTITETGTVEDVRVLNSVPPGVFDQSAVASLRQWRFAVLMRDGVPVERTGRRTSISFFLE